MAIDFDTTPTIEKSLRQHLMREAIKGALKPADPKLPPTEPPLLNMSPRRHDVVRWDHDGMVTYTSHETKERALDFASTLHWATTWKWAVMCGRELVEKRVLQIPADYADNLQQFEACYAQK